MLMNVVTGHRRHLLVSSDKRAYWEEWGHGDTADQWPLDLLVVQAQKQRAMMMALQFEGTPKWE